MCMEESENDGTTIKPSEFVTNPLYFDGNSSRSFGERYAIEKY